MSPSLGHLLLPLPERRPAKEMAIPRGGVKAEDSQLIHHSTSCVADYRKYPQMEVSLPQLQCMQQGTCAPGHPALACADRYLDRPASETWQP